MKNFSVAIPFATMTDVSRIWLISSGEKFESDSMRSHSAFHSSSASLRGGRFSALRRRAIQSASSAEFVGHFSVRQMGFAAKTRSIRADSLQLHPGFTKRCPNWNRYYSPNSQSLGAVDRVAHERKLALFREFTPHSSTCFCSAMPPKTLGEAHFLV